MSAGKIARRAPGQARLKTDRFAVRCEATRHHATPALAAPACHRGATVAQGLTNIAADPAMGCGNPASLSDSGDADGLPRYPCKGRGSWTLPSRRRGTPYSNALIFSTAASDQRFLVWPLVARFRSAAAVPGNSSRGTCSASILSTRRHSNNRTTSAVLVRCVAPYNGRCAHAIRAARRPI